MVTQNARQCKAQSSQTGERCRANAMRGQLVCYSHGGATKLGRNAGERRLAEEEVHQLAIETLRDAAPMRSAGDVYEELLAVAGVTRQWRMILQERVAQLQELDQWGGDAGRQIRVDVVLFERALERSGKIAEAIARLNLEERKQALDERMAGLLAGVVQAILSDLDLTPEQSARAAVVAPQRMRELA